MAQTQRQIVVIGGGVAGMQAALTTAAEGMHTVIVEKADRLGGKLCGWHKLFPTLTPAHEVLDELVERVSKAGIEVLTDCEANEVTPDHVRLVDGRTIAADAVIVASGFDIFDARIKEEYGYGIYDNVFTTVDIERMMNDGSIRCHDGRVPRRIALLHCVGSRDEKVGQRHCSRVCCITGVKQAMELKEMFPESEIFNFYMDIRMFGPGYEEMYRHAQQHYNINFIRGRISEASPTFDGRIQIKAEDTLIGRPLKMSVDMLILIVGMRCGTSNHLFERTGLQRTQSGFMMPADMFAGNVDSTVRGVFYAGTVTAPKNIGESLNEGVAAGMRAVEYVKNRS